LASLPSGPAAGAWGISDNAAPASITVPRPVHSLIRVTL
jgi:hypothetical protein